MSLPVIAGDRVRLRVEVFDPESTVEQLGTVLEAKDGHLGRLARVVWDAFTEEAEEGMVTVYPADLLQVIDP